MKTYLIVLTEYFVKIIYSKFSKTLCYTKTMQ